MLKSNWKLERLDNVLKVVRGSSPRPIKNFITDDIKGVNWIKIGDVGENEKYVISTKEKITLEGAERSRFVDVGDFIFSNSMSFGRAYIMKIPGYIHDGWFTFKLPPELDSHYLWYLFKSPYLIEQIKQLASGAIVQNISSDLVKKCLLPIPPLEEQKAIVAKLDQAFAAIDQAKANIEKNIANAKELFKSKLNQIFSQKGEGWEEKKIKDVALVTAGQSPEGKYYNDKGIGLPFYQGKKEFTEKLIGEPKVWTEKITKEALEGDVLMSVRAPVGPINFATQKCCIGRGLASIRVKENFDKDFLFFYFKNIENQLTGNSGAVFNSINKNQIEQIQIIYPNIIEQRIIVSRLVNLQEKSNLLVTKYQQKLANLEELKKSILEKAFKGELV